MYYLSKYPDVQCILMEDIFRSEPEMPPLFYMGQWPRVLNISENHPVKDLGERPDPWGNGWVPRFVLFFDDKDVAQRAATLQHYLPGLVYETTIKPSFIDDILFRMNPRNTNQTIVIYRNRDFIPDKIE